MSAAMEYERPTNPADFNSIIPELCFSMSRNIVGCPVFVDDCYVAAIDWPGIVLGVNT